MDAVGVGFWPPVVGDGFGVFTGVGVGLGILVGMTVGVGFG